VGEGSIGLSHSVSVITLLNGGSLPVRGITEFTGKFLDH
jgi:hypothetical protein